MRAKRMCKSCPFRGCSETERKDLAVVPAGHWPCHTDDTFGSEGIDCRGHWEARRKYPPSDDATAAWLAEVYPPDGKQPGLGGEEPGC